jgi:hypothetical protein
MKGGEKETSFLILFTKFYNFPPQKTTKRKVRTPTEAKMPKRRRSSGNKMGSARRRMAPRR